jgi:CHRD domain
MRQTFRRESILGTTVGVIASVMLLAGAGGSGAETLQFRAELKGSNQVPPNQTAGTGMVIAIYDSTTKQLSWNGSYSSLSGPATGAHIHGPAAAGVNARLVVWISNNVGQCSQGQCRSRSDDQAHYPGSPFQGLGVLTDAQAADLTAGLYYVNVHTDAYPAGEIRGQLMTSP